MKHWAFSFPSKWTYMGAEAVCKLLICWVALNLWKMCSSCLSVSEQSCAQRHLSQTAGGVAVHGQLFLYLSPWWPVRNGWADGESILNALLSLFVLKSTLLSYRSSPGWFSCCNKYWCWRKGNRQKWPTGGWWSTRNTDTLVLCFKGIIHRDLVSHSQNLNLESFLS